jgi:hypothetical protein
VHLVGFTIGIYYDAWTYEREISVLCLFCRFSVDPALKLCILTPRFRAKLIVSCSLRPHFSTERNQWYLKDV